MPDAVSIARTIPNRAGTVTFEQSENYRAYHWVPDPVVCPECDGKGRDYTRSAAGRKCPAGCVDGMLSKRRRLTSVTTLIGGILEKPGLVPWGEAAGARGAIEAVRLGFLDPEYEGAADMAPGIVRANRLGADAARDQAATRGLTAHDLLQSYLEHGEVPNPADHHPDHHGYIRAASRWLLHASPEPEAIETIVADPDAGYAGRLDLVARINGERVLADFKTSANGSVWNAAHLQLGLLERGMLWCGDGPVDRRVVVALSSSGEFREAEGLATPEVVDAAISFARLLRPITSACERGNRVERQAVAA